MLDESEFYVSYYSLLEPLDLVKNTFPVEFILIDFHLILNAYHLQSSISRAMYNRTAGCMKTKSIDSEIAFCLSGSMKIDDAVKQYFVSEASTYIAAISFKRSNTNLSVAASLLDAGKVDNLAVDDPTKLEAIVSAFKVPAVLANDYASIEKFILTRIATKTIA